MADVEDYISGAARASTRCLYAIFFVLMLLPIAGLVRHHIIASFYSKCVLKLVCKTLEGTVINSPGGEHGAD